MDTGVWQCIEFPCAARSDKYYNDVIEIALLFIA